MSERRGATGSATKVPRLARSADRQAAEGGNRPALQASGLASAAGAAALGASQEAAAAAARGHMPHQKLRGSPGYRAMIGTAIGGYPR